MLLLQGAAAAGSWAWAKYADKIRDRFVDSLGTKALDKLTNVSAEAWDRFQWKKAAERYRQKVEELYGTTRLLGKPNPISLDEIFTDLLILDKPTAYKRYNISELRKDPSRLKPSVGQRVNALRLVANPEKKRLFILGKPGSGKTTFLKYIAVQCSRKNIDRIPIFVGLKEWADSGHDLTTFITNEFDICNFPDASPFVDYILDNGYAMVLFDGLDEVKLENEKRRKTINEIRDFTNKYLQTHCLVTCRIAATDYTFDHFDYVEIADFTDKQIFDFAKKWFGDDLEKLNAFQAGITKPENKGLYEIASVPILLTLICLAFDTTNEFPERRVDVYGEGINALLRLWDATKNVERDVLYGGLTLKRKRQLLSHVAFLTFKEGKYFIDQDEMSSHIASFLQTLSGQEVGADVDGDAVLKSIEAHHGILSERAHRIYSFSHLTFQEYFAANEVVHDTSGDRLIGLLAAETVASDRWREVILMTATLLSDTNLFFERFKEAIESMVGQSSNMLSMFEWADRQAKTSFDAERLVVGRLYYLSLGLIFDIDRSASRERARICQVALTRAEQFVQLLQSEVDLFRHILTAFALGLNKMRADNIALELDRDYDLPQELEMLTEASPTSKREFDLELTRLQFITDLLTHSVNEGPRRALALKFADYYRRVRQQCGLSMSSDLDGALNQITPSGRELVRHDRWVRFADLSRRDLQTERDVGHDWRLSTTNVEDFDKILQASRLVYDCFQVAKIQPAQFVSQALFGPPQFEN
jgi:hypothetical protein